MGLLREELGVEATLIKGHGGIFTVAVNSDIVARKTLAGFPDDEEILRSVERALRLAEKSS
jgi:predicted Rdx family selenoprotein